MSTITPLASGDNGATSRTTINTNFSNLNTDKMETSVLDTDTTLAANSDSKVATQKAVKAYADALLAVFTNSRSGVSAGPASSSTQTITHSLGHTPIVIRIKGYGSATAGNGYGISDGTYNATGNRCIYTIAGTGTKTSASSTTYAVRLVIGDSGGESVTATGVIQNVTATTFDIVWTASASVATCVFLWEAN